MRSGSAATVSDADTIANYDPAIIPLLDELIGSAFERRGLFGKLVKVPLELPTEQGA